jgi:phosphoserine phosphatase
MKCRLKAKGWNQKARSVLERLIQRRSGQRLPVVFDFDNTLISGDVGEAVLAILAAEGSLRPGNVCKTLCPDLSPLGRKRLRVEDCSNVMEYYEALLAPTAHGPADPTPLANGYAWATEVLEGLTVADVLAATARAYQLGRANPDASITVMPGTTRYPVPRFHEEMVELIGQLLRSKYEVWIASASNVWSVRWMVLHGLNPLLKAQGVAEGLPPQHVIGVATLMENSEGRLCKDSVLVREQARYAVLDSRMAKAFRITRHLQFPVPVYSGKVACVLDAIGRAPYLCAGDSPSDHPMLRLSRHRLWIARQDKPQSQHATRALIGETGEAGWILQAVQAEGKFSPEVLTADCVLSVTGRPADKTHTLADGTDERRDPCRPHNSRLHVASAALPFH